MEKYIKADTVLKFINSCLEHEDKITDIEKAVLTGVKTCVERISAADVVEARHGRWLSKEYMYGDPDVGVENEWVERLAEHSDYYAYCSACGKDAEYNGEGSLVLSDYCPSCGAKMDGGINE